MVQALAGAPRGERSSWVLEVKVRERDNAAAQATRQKEEGPNVEGKCCMGEATGGRKGNVREHTISRFPLWGPFHCLIVGHSPGSNCIGQRGASKNRMHKWTQTPPQTNRWWSLKFRNFGPGIKLSEIGFQFATTLRQFCAPLTQRL